MKTFILAVLFISLSISLKAQVPTPALIGYWQNWDDGNNPYIQLNQIDNRYNVVEIAFALPATSTVSQMQFIPDAVSQDTLISQIQTLQSEGKKVIISAGGETAPISLSTTGEKDMFINTMDTIINTYGFDGIDIDFEGGSLLISGGTIATPVDSPVINLIAALKQIMQDYRISHHKKLLLSLVPETADVQGGMSYYGSIWGSYLPVIAALQDSIDVLQVQLYNTGTMYGIDGNIYTEGTADFIVAETEACIQGFNTSGGLFAGLPASKVVVGLPACASAAGGGYTDTATVTAAMRYLLGTGPKPGSYTLRQTGGYPTLAGMMTWSINWDSTCSGGNYAANFERIFAHSGSTASGLCAGASISFSANITGTNYQWQLNSGSGFSNIANNTTYTGTNTATLQLNNLSSSWYGYQYQCIVDGNASSIYTLQFANTWTSGAGTSAWETPGNWSCGIVPDSNSDVIINSGTVIIDSTVNIRSLSLSPTVQLTISSGDHLTILH